MLVLLLCGSRSWAEPLDEHLKVLGVDRLHREGFDGSGKIIAILDTGFVGYKNQLGKTLPEEVVARSFRIDRNLEGKSTLHGMSCAEIIHSVAPGAKLLLANWEPDSPEHFLDAVKWAKAEGANVISCSVVMPGWSDGRGGGEVHRKLKAILGDPENPKTPLFFAAVGNFAERHQTRTFRDDGNGGHLWSEGKSLLSLTPWSGAPVCLELTHSPKVEYRMEVRDPSGRQVGTRFGPAAEGMTGHSIRFFPQTPEAHTIRIEKVRGDGEAPFRLITLSASLSSSDPVGSVAFPGDGEEVIGIGAVDEKRNRESYSGCGYDKNKPDCVAMVPFPTRTQPAFSGTSAAAPQAAGLAAVIWSAEPQMGSAVVRTRILESCLDLGLPGVDRETGRGLIRIKK